MSTSPKTAIVTGAGSGIGKVVALALLDAGWHVALAGRRQEALQAVAEQSGSLARTLVVPTDVSDPAAVQHLFDTVLRTWGRVDLLFNNAGSVGALSVVRDRSHNSEAEVFVAKRGRVAAAVRSAGVIRRVVPRATTEHPGCACHCSDWISHWQCFIVGLIPIPNPLPHVPA